MEPFSNKSSWPERKRPCSLVRPETQLAQKDRNEEKVNFLRSMDCKVQGWNYRENRDWILAAKNTKVMQIQILSSFPFHTCLQQVKYFKKEVVILALVITEAPSKLFLLRFQSGSLIPLYSYRSVLSIMGRGSGVWKVEQGKKLYSHCSNCYQL